MGRDFGPAPSFYGQMSEWFKELVLKTSGAANVRGFESHSGRHISILNKKANRYGGSVIKVNTFETKASQFDHTDESYTKKRLSERMAHLSSGEVVQRDLYSAFLLEHIDIESLQYNMETLNSAFPAFLEMHENTKRRLQAVGSSLPASIGF